MGPFDCFGDSGEGSICIRLDFTILYEYQRFVFCCSNGVRIICGIK